MDNYFEKEVIFIGICDHCSMSIKITEEQNDYLTNYLTFEYKAQNIYPKYKCCAGCRHRVNNKLVEKYYICVPPFDE